MNMQRPYGSLLPVEGEGEDEDRSKATDSYSDQAPPSILFPSLRGEAAFAEIE
jgi:hypothetical protein